MVDLSPFSDYVRYNVQSTEKAAASDEDEDWLEQNHKLLHREGAKEHLETPSIVQCLGKGKVISNWFERLVEMMQENQWWFLGSGARNENDTYASFINFISWTNYYI